MAITLNGCSYTHRELLDWDPSSDHPSRTENERNTLIFCQQWLSGQQQFIVNTSGSTGVPKAIALARSQMEASARRTGQTLGLCPGQRALVCLPTRYIAGRMMLVRGFVLGLALTVVEPSSDPLALFSEDARFDFAALIPLQLQTLLNGPPVRQTILNRMSAILIGGGPVSVALHQQLQSLTAPVYHTYGMTETVTHIALRRLNGPDASDAFVPLRGVQVGVDARGCLTVQSDVTRGELLATNDCVELRQDGSFIWLGRLDNVINSGGVKIQVEQVEEALARLFFDLAQGDAQCSAYGRRFFVGSLPDERLGESVTAIFEGEPFGAELTSQIQKGLTARLSQYAVPRHFCYLTRFAETPTGKIDRQRTLRQITTPRPATAPSPSPTLPACSR